MFVKGSRLTSLAGGAAFGLAVCGACASAVAEQPARSNTGSVQQAAAPNTQKKGAVQQTAAPAAAPVPQQAAADQPAPAGSDPALLQRLDNLEHTVKELNEIINTQQPKPGTQAVKVTTKGGLMVESEDGQFSGQLFGRFHFDGNWFDQDKSKMGDGLQVRRARIGVTGKMFGDWMYKVEYDFGAGTGSAGAGTTTAALKEAWIKYIGLPGAEFLVGNVPVPFGLEQYTSDNFTSFVERALPSPVFAPERLLGFVGGYYDPNWSFASGIYGKKMDDAHAGVGDDQTVFTARGTVDPISEKTKLVHFGLGFLWENPSDQPVTFSTNPEENVSSIKFLSTALSATPAVARASPGQLTSIDHLYMINPELVLMYGPASLQGEYFYVPVTQGQHIAHAAATGAACQTQAGIAAANSQCPDVTLSGWYAQASYFLTGESRNWNPKSAKWDRTSINHNLGKDGLGAVELLARMSNLDFDDGPAFQKGTETDYTLGVNWYVNPYIRFMFNYIFVQNNASALGNIANHIPSTPGSPAATQANAGYDDPRIFEFRAQVDF
jgi:phosphate-selective porin OprO/OprP